MKEEYIPYEQAFQLKEIGFDEDCLGSYCHWHDNPEMIAFWPNQEAETSDTQAWKPVCNAPLYQQAFRWFRIKHSIFINIHTATNVNEILGHTLWIKSWMFHPVDAGSFLDYQETELEALKWMIDFVKKKGQERWKLR